MKKSNTNWLKVYAISLTVCIFLIIGAFCIVLNQTKNETDTPVEPETTVRSTEPNWAVVGWNNTLEKLDYDADIVFFGDSIIRGSDFREYFPELKIVNSGYPGDTLKGMISRVSGIAAVTPEKVFVMGGINGLTDTNVEDSISIYGKLLDTMIEQLPDSQIFVQSVLPVSSDKELIYCHNTTIAEFNSKLNQLAEEKGAEFVDLFSLYELNGEMNPDLTKDGIHLHPEAYEPWADTIAAYLE